jgi:hypothetical protein
MPTAVVLLGNGIESKVAMCAVSLGQGEYKCDLTLTNTYASMIDRLGQYHGDVDEFEIRK